MMPTEETGEEISEEKSYSFIEKLVEGKPIVYTDGDKSIGFTKVTENEQEFVRVGLSYPLQNTFDEDDSGLPKKFLHGKETMMMFQDLIDLIHTHENFKDRPFRATRGKLRYGYSVGVKDNNAPKGDLTFQYSTIPFGDYQIPAETLTKVIDELDKKYGFAGFKKDIVSLNIPYDGFKKTPGVNIDLMDELDIGSVDTVDMREDKVVKREKKTSVGIRVEFYMPANQYKLEDFAEAFDAVGQTVALTPLEKAMEDIEMFFTLVDENTPEPTHKVVKKVTV